jgi:hypothetical protein
MATLGREELAWEWRTSREHLCDILGQPPESAAVPGGFLSHAVIEAAARAGYRLLMTSQPTAKASFHEGMLIHGRYTIWSATSPERAAAYARGDPLALARLWLAWQAKAAPKRFSPSAYESLRQRWAKLRPGPRRSR